jgi:hypothetical protein
MSEVEFVKIKVGFDSETEQVGFNPMVISGLETSKAVEKFMSKASKAIRNTWVNLNKEDKEEILRLMHEKNLLK